MPHDKLTQVQQGGSAHMVDVSAKAPTERTPRARASAATTEGVTTLMQQNSLAKGDALAAARIAETKVLAKTGGRSGDWERT